MTQIILDDDERVSRFVITDDDVVIITPAGSGEFEDYPDTPDAPEGLFDDNYE